MSAISSDFSSGTSFSLSGSTAYLLVTHGSRDPRSHRGAIALSHHLSHQLAQSPVGTAVLELGPVPLHRQILNFIQQVRLPSGGCLKVLPLFLLPGVHVMEDIPAEIDLARQALARQALARPAGETVHLELLPYLGSQETAMAGFLSEYLQSIDELPSIGELPSIDKLHQRPGHRILMAHGSNRPGATVVIEALAQRLGMRTAYWIQPERLVEHIREISQEIPEKVPKAPVTASVMTGDASVSAEVVSTSVTSNTAIRRSPQSIEILPYFLFEGGITDAIAQRLKVLEQQFPGVQLRLRPTLSEIPDFAHLVQQHLSLGERSLGERLLGGRSLGEQVNRVA